MEERRDASSWGPRERVALFSCDKHTLRPAARWTLPPPAQGPSLFFPVWPGPARHPSKDKMAAMAATLGLAHSSTPSLYIHREGEKRRRQRVILKVILGPSCLSRLFPSFVSFFTRGIHKAGRGARERRVCRERAFS